MRRKLITIAALVSLAGIFVSAVSIKGYFHIQKAGLENPTFCTISERINCDVVNASSYATELGIPVAGWGLIYYALVLLLSAFAKFSGRSRRSALTFLWWTSIFAVIYSVYMAYVMAFILKTICITCVTQYAINLILLTLLWIASGTTTKTAIGYIHDIFLPKRPRLDFKPRMFSYLIASMVVAGVGYLFLLNAVQASGRIGQEELTSLVAAYFRQSLYDLPREELKGKPFWGDANAPVTIIEFSDFQCTFCRVAAFNIRPYLAEFKDNVRYTFVNYPLDNSCNQYIERPFHKTACLAAKAAICADRQGKFWEYHDRLFRNQDRLNERTISELAKDLGLDGQSFSTCLDSEETASRLKEDIEIAHRVYIQGTPSIIVNGRLLRAWRSPEVLRAVVKKEITKIKVSK